MRDDFLPLLLFLSSEPEKRDRRRLRRPEAQTRIPVNLLLHRARLEVRLCSPPIIERTRTVCPSKEMPDYKIGFNDSTLEALDDSNDNFSLLPPLVTPDTDRPIFLQTSNPISLDLLYIFATIPELSSLFCTISTFKELR